MNCYFLDKVSWQHSQSLYHAAAHLQREALFILRPETPYICLGFHQDAEQEIDLDFARDNQIPVIRREVGGGAVYLDSGQLFYQLIIRADRPEIPANKTDFYRIYLQPVIDTYAEIGVEASFKPVNDIIVNNRKVSGNGAAEIEGMLVLVGNFILDFNYEMMSKSLRVPDEKFRDKVFKSLQENLSTVLRETGKQPSSKSIADSLIPRYESLLGPLPILTDLDDELLAEADLRFNEMYTDEWLFNNDRRRPDERKLKIREDVYVIQNMLKTPGGLMRVSAISDAGNLTDVHVSGDFFFYPAADLKRLEDSLSGVAEDKDAITSAIKEFYKKNSIESPGVQPADIAQAFAPASD
jgi:lipoate---protein ligase